MSVRTYLETLDRGLERYLKPGDRSRKYEYYFNSDRKKYDKNGIVYDMISGFVDTEERLNRIHKYEEGRLRPVDLLGDHIYFEGASRDGDTNIIEYFVGS